MSHGLWTMIGRRKDRSESILYGVRHHKEDGRWSVVQMGLKSEAACAAGQMSTVDNFT